MFGAVNQLLAALGLLVLTIYLKKKGGLKFLVAALPCIFMLVMTIWGAVMNKKNFITSGNWLLILINGIILLLAIWMIVESIIIFMKKDSR